MDLPFPVALLGLAVLTAGGIAVSFALGNPAYVWVVVGIVGVTALLYLYRYSQRPGPETELSTELGLEDAEPFIDPVEEADRAVDHPIDGPTTEETKSPEAPTPIGPP